MHRRNKREDMQDINRLKILLVEKKKTSKWLSEQLAVNPTTVSKWCTNTSQPSLDMIFRIMHILDVDINQIINVPSRNNFANDIEQKLNANSN